MTFRIRSNWFDDTRPDDIGVSVSYPLPGTKFFERVHAQLGEKTNWSDSEDLAMMFQGAYTNEFYRALHDALHAQVDSWNSARARCSTKKQHDLDPERTVAASLGTGEDVPQSSPHRAGPLSAADHWCSCKRLPA